MTAKKGEEHDHEHHNRLPGGRTLGHYCRDFLRNWAEYDAPLFEKLRLGIRNRWLSTGRLRPCCGHPGEPGC
jgi:hypothetical protein